MTNIRRMMHNSHATSQDWENLLKSCESICSGESLSLAYVLQEHFIEDHTPLYWAIIKRDEGDPITDPDLFTILLRTAAPLTEPTVSDIYCACIMVSDQALFQSLRFMPEFSSPVSGMDQLLLSHTSDRDKVTVDDIPGVNGSFVVGFEIAQFWKRMRVSREITVEFIARGRMWRLTFFISSRDMGRRPRGSWCMSLCLLNHSPPTFIDGKFVIDEYKSRSWTATPIARATSIANPPKSSITIPCRSYRQLSSTASSSHNALIMALEDSPIGSSIQYKGNTFIGPDETLRFGLYALLRKPSLVDLNYDDQDECVIS
ncbi:hypothetical protein BDZ94DRAFT_1257331 [Collybia nuda]|uniref:Uncharacterized protein n=1 Tax=Collybia nuda TaxID=64659 RepID=A0A9P5Y8A7_9AGAR|nr:hypothetical protein BDZ94DRAFT_1257331 [Collybia nuda]